MSVDERDEPYATLPDLGHHAPALLRAREAEREQTRAAIADIRWHDAHEARIHRDRLISAAAWLLALCVWLVAVGTARESWTWPLVIASVATVVVFAVRSGQRCRDEDAHRAECPGVTR